MNSITQPKKHFRKAIWSGIALLSAIGGGLYGLMAYQDSMPQAGKPLAYVQKTEKHAPAKTELSLPQEKAGKKPMSIKEQYRSFVENHPHLTRQKLTKKQMKEMGIPKKDRPDLAAELEFLKTMNPATLTVPRTALQIAREKTKEALKKSKAAIAGVTWTERGPNNVGGRTHALMFDPNDATRKKVWAGAVAGGLWFNNDITSSASSWQKVNDFWATISVSTIVADPSNSQTFYVGTGEGFTQDARGAGIWKSTNGGTTWNQLASTTPTNSNHFTWIQKIVVHSSGTIFAATRSNVSGSGGVLRSTDGGLTWMQIYNTATADIDIASNGDIYIGTFAGVVARTTNPTAVGNPTWTNFNPSSGGQRVELAIAPSASSVTGSTVVYAVSSNGSDVQWFRKTTDGGTTWTSVTVPKYLEQSCSFGTTDFTRGQSWYDLTMKVRPDNANVVLVGGIDLYGTTNGGTSWNLLSYWTGGCSRQYVHADQHAIEFRSTNFNEIIGGNDGGVTYSTNAGTGSSTGVLFSDRNNNYNVTQFYACAMNNTNGSNVYIAGAQDNGTQRFTSAGINSTTEVNGGDGGFCFIDQTNPNIAIASYVYNNFYRSTNGGSSFTGELLGENTGLFINPADYDHTANVLYTAGNSGTMKRVRNVETSPVEDLPITLSGVGQITTIKANCFTANRIYVGNSSGDVFRVDNAHATPTVTNISGSLPAGYTSSIDVGANDDELLVTYSNYGVKSVYYTNNGGTTWVSKDETAYGLPDMPIRWALFNPNDTKQVLLATELGVWSTSDVKATNPGWEPTNSGLANVRCDMLRFRTADKQVAIATFGRGLYTTNAFASTPTAANANFTYAPRQIIYQPAQMTFTDASLGTITSRSWNFGSGASPATSTATAPPAVSYSTLGTKTVSLTVNGTSTKTSDIVVLPTFTPSYLPADGGNFDTDNKHFYPAPSAMPFQRGNSAIAGKNGTASGSFAYVIGATATQYPNATESILYTPNYNFSTAGAYSFSFKTKYSVEANYDGFIVEYSTNQGATWTKLGNSVVANWYNGTVDASGGGSGFPANTVLFTGSASTFETKTFDCSSLAGNANVTFRFVFKSDDFEQGTGVALDDVQVTGPASAFVHTALSPANTSTGVAVNANLTMTFPSTVSKGTGNILIRRMSDNVTLETISASGTAVSVLGSVATINPVNDFPSGVAVYVEVPTGAFKNASNVNNTGFTGSSTWSFTASETVPPTLVSLSPANSATNVAVATNLVMTMNENVQKGTGNIVIKRSSDANIFATIDVTSSLVTISGAVVTINPTNNLASNTQYFVEVANGAIKDLAGNNYAGFSNAGTWQFTTADVAPPVVASLTPTNGATNVSLTNSFAITFNENIAQNTGTITIKRSSDNSVFETITLPSNLVSISTVSAVINPINNLQNNTQYYIEISNGAITDLAGNVYAGFTGNSTWQFSTPDDIPPTVVSFSPDNGVTNASPTANLVMTFNENVQKGAGNIVIKRSSDNVTVETISVSATAVSIAGAVVTINPANDLPAGVQYYVEVVNGAIKDLANNNFVGFVGSSTWLFSVVDAIAPTLVSLSPANNATNIVLGANLVMTFNENMQKASSGTINIKRVTNNTTFESINISNVTVAGAVVTINPTNDLEANTQYYVEVPSGVLKDLANNDYAGFVTNTAWRFTSIDNVVPTLISTSPINNATAFPGANNLEMTFSENMRKGTTGTIVIRRVDNNSTVALFDMAGASASRITITGAIVTINPTNDLPFNTDLFVEVSNDALEDLAGNKFAGLTGTTAWRFKTDFSTAIEDSQLNRAISLFPNPVAKDATLTIENGLVLKNAEMQVFDTRGTAVWTEQASQLTAKQTLNFQNLPAGKYFLQIRVGEAVVLKPFVKVQ
jgi:methionine-rich copper-binding protein CopC